MTDAANWKRDLEDEIAHLRATLKKLCGDGGDSMHVFNLSPSQERILRLLLIREFAPHAAIEAALYWDKLEIGSDEVAKVHIHNIRRRLPAIAKDIICKPGRGYYLTPQGKHWVKAELIVARAA